MSTIWLKLTVWWPEQCSVIEKVKPHRARILFLEIGKTCPKWFVQSILFYYQLGLKWRLPTKLTQIPLKLTIWWPKHCSVIEKVHPRRARILSLEKDKTCPMWFVLSIFYILSATMAEVEPAHQKWAQFDWNWRFGNQNKVRWSKNLSLIERKLFFWK